MYSSMDVDHSADQAQVNTSIDAVAKTNRDIAGRLAPNGDIGTLAQKTSTFRTNHADCTSAASSLSTINSTKWVALTNHISSVPAAPTCASLPPSKTAATMKAFFSSNSYADWYTTQKLSFDTKYNDYKTASSNLASKLSECKTLKTKLATEYCAW